MSCLWRRRRGGGGGKRGGRVVWTSHSSCHLFCTFSIAKFFCNVPKQIFLLLPVPATLRILSAPPSLPPPPVDIIDFPLSLCHSLHLVSHSLYLWSCVDITKKILPPCWTLLDGLKIYFFLQAECWSDCVNTTIELKQVYRQKDPLFISILQNVRVGRYVSFDIFNFLH